MTATVSENSGWKKQLRFRLGTGAHSQRTPQVSWNDRVPSTLATF